MAVRPFLTTAVSVATAITVSASLALAPPMSPRDMKVASDAQVALAADEGLIKALVDGYFYDGNGTEGVIQALLLRIAGGYVPATTMINGYFDVKPPEALRQWLVANTDPTNLVALEYINRYFGDPAQPDLPSGPQEAIRLQLLAHFQDPQQVAFINDYFDNGPPGVIRTQLLVRLLDPQQQEFIKDYFGDPANPDAAFGPPEVIRKQLVTRFQDPQQVEFINDYFQNGGPPGVIRKQLLVRFLDPQQQEFIKDYFGDPADPDRPFGPPIVIRNQLLARTSDPVQQALINAYFAGGPKEVLRLLLDPVDSTPAPEPLSAFSARASAPEEPPAADTFVASPDTSSTPAAAAAVAVPAQAPPAAAPVEAPAKSATIAEEKSGGAQDVSEAMKGGNKAVVEPIVPVGSNGANGGVNVFGQIAAAIHTFVTGEQPSGGATGAGGTTDGGADGGGSADGSEGGGS